MQHQTQVIGYEIDAKFRADHKTSASNRLFDYICLKFKNSSIFTSFER